MPFRFSGAVIRSVYGRKSVVLIDLGHHYGEISGVL